MKLKKGVVLQNMGESFVAFDNETSTLHELNETAYLILAEIEKGKTKTETVRDLNKNYSWDKNEIAKDYEFFVKVLLKKDLIVGRK